MSNRTNDPLGLFSKPTQPTSHQPSTQDQVGTSKSPSDGLGESSKLDFATLLIGCLIGAAVLLIYQRLGNDRGSNDRDRGQQEQRDDGRKDQPATSYKTLIFLHERNPQSIEHDLLLREMPKFCEANKMEFRAFDDDTPDTPIPELLSWSKSKGVEPPLVVITDKDDRPVKAAKWPNGLDELKALLK